MDYSLCKVFECKRISLFKLFLIALITSGYCKINVHNFSYEWILEYEYELSLC